MLAVVLWIMLPRGVSPERRPLPRLSDHLLIYSTPRLFAPGLGHGIYAFLFPRACHLPAGGAGRAMAVARVAGRGVLTGSAPDRAACAAHRPRAAGLGRLPRAGGVLRGWSGRPGHWRLGSRSSPWRCLHRGGRGLCRRALAQPDQCRPCAGQWRAGAAGQCGHLRAARRFWRRWGWRRPFRWPSRSAFSARLPTALAYRAAQRDAELAASCG